MHMRRMLEQASQAMPCSNPRKVPGQIVALFVIVEFSGLQVLK